MTAAIPTISTRPDFWPRGLPRTAHVPATTLPQNLAIATQRFPHKPALVYFDTPFTYARIQRDSDALAGWLQTHAGVANGDRVALLSQSCPQLAIAYYAILRAGAVVVPINAMSTAEEIRHYAIDSGARVAIVSRDLLEQAQLAGFGQLVSFCYADALETPTDLAVPDWITRRTAAPEGVIEFQDAIAANLAPGPMPTDSHAVCVLPYTSGTTGRPKGCVHTHASMSAALQALVLWRRLHSETVFLGVAPMFHMLGMQNGMNLPILLGATVVIVPRWDRVHAATCIERYRVTAWTCPAVALADFFTNPDVDGYDLSSLVLVTGGGGSVPPTVSERLERHGLRLNEGYGMSETASFMLCNPLDRSKTPCLGIPTFGVDVKIIDPDTLKPLPTGEVGEIVAAGPQLMTAYWNNPKATAETFIEMDGRRYLRTGDLGRMDEEGYFFMTDRLKRMINVSGFKVWPAEVENKLYELPGVQEACVVGVPDERQGEAVKVIIVLRPEARGTLAEADVIQWARANMAVYKTPRSVAFVDSLPRTSTGKVLWRELR